MHTNDNITDEIKEISPTVAYINRQNVYMVPPGYFSGLAEQLLSYVKQHSSENILPSSSIPYTVPQGYFNNLADAIINKVKQQPVMNDVTHELAGIAPLLNTINKNPVYTVPVGYFENLKPEVTSTTKVISLNKTRRFTRYAAAAAISGLMIMGGIFYTNNDKTGKTAGPATTFNQQEVNQLSDEEIVNYLNNHPATDVISTNMEPDNLKINTKELTDEEIINFLKQNGELSETFDHEG